MDPPHYAITFDSENRHWILRGPGILSVYRFATRGEGAIGLVGAIGTALFTGRDSGGRIRIKFRGEVIDLRFDSQGERTQFSV